jgi:hypothetical protein
MEWTEIDYNGTKIHATDFCDGVLVVVPSSAGMQPVYIPGWKVQQQEAEMNGPALRRRDKKKQVFNLLAMEQL